MLECIKFGDCTVKKIQIRNEWFLAVCDIDITLRVNSDRVEYVNIYLSDIGFQKRKLVFMFLIMASNFPLQCSSYIRFNAT